MTVPNRDCQVGTCGCLKAIYIGRYLLSSIVALERASRL